MSDQIKNGKVAGGVPAIIATVKAISEEMGLVRGARTLLKINQIGGVDCPGCAWPEPDQKRSHFEFCENGAKHVADEATSKRVTPEFFQKWSVAELAEQSDQWLNAQGRLTHPMLLNRDASHYEPVSWDDAFELLSAELNSLNYPDQAIFYTSGRTSNEAAFLYQLFVRQFGTNNLPDCSNMCHESSGTALGETIGVGKGTVTLEDFDKAEAIFVIGQNPGTNHPRMLTSLERAKQNGCKLVHINPLPEVGMTRFKHPQHVLGLLGSGTELADLFLQVRINGDVALLKGITKAVLAHEDALDRDFINRYTNGFDDFVSALQNVSWNEIVEQSGVAKRSDRTSGRDLCRVGAHDLLLGHGAHATSQCRRKHSGDRQPDVVAWPDRKTRCGFVSGAWSQQRAGRSHGWYLGTAD